MQSPSHETGMVKVHFGSDIIDLIEQKDGRLSTYVFEGSVKSAASDLFSREDIQRLSPPKGKFGIHKVVMGSQEMYGYNRNADGYPADGLVRNRHTFEKIALCFREHDNKDPRKALGIIKEARWDPNLQRIETFSWVDINKAPEEYAQARRGEELSFSQACFVAGTLVRMADGTERAIEDIRPGDTVVTHQGRIGEVSHFMRRDYSGIGIKLRAAGLPEAIVCTEDHGIWTRPSIKGESICPVCGERFAQLACHLWQKKDAQHAAARANFGKFAEGFRGARALKPGDYIRMPFDQTEIGSVSDSLAILLGFYLAEGSATEGKTRPYKGTGRRYARYALCFTFSDTERHYAEEVVRLLAQNGWASSITDTPKYHKLTVYCSSPEALRWFVKHGGKYSHGKQLSREAMQWPATKQKLILGRWLEGDGGWSAINKVLTGTTVSRNLAWQLMVVAARNDMVPNMGSHQAKGKRRSYTLTFPGSDSIDSSCDKVPASFMAPKPSWAPCGHLRHQPAGRLALRTPAARKSFIENGFIYRQIRKANQVFINEPVYDLTVPTDHGFTVNGYGVSNCRVAQDECSCCHHKAASSKNYCEHLRHRMAQYLPSFKKYAFAINRDPKFFDESFVKRGADRIARYLEYRFADDEMLKAASSVPEFISGTDWAEVMGIRAYDELDNRFIEEIEKLAAAEQYIADIRLNQPDAPEIRYSQLASFAPADLDTDTLRSIYPGTMMNKFARESVMLPFDCFVAYVTERSVKDVREDSELMKVAAEQLPVVFRSLVDKPCRQSDVDLFDSAGDYSSNTDPSLSPVVDAVFAEANAKFSAKDDPAQARLVESIFMDKKSSAEIGNIPLNPVSDLHPLISFYGAFKLASVVNSIQRPGHHINPDVLRKCACNQNFNF